MLDNTSLLFQDFLPIHLSIEVEDLDESMLASDLSRRFAAQAQLLLIS